MKKLIFLFLFLSFALDIQAQELITGFNNETLSVLNEELRKGQIDELVKASTNDTSSGYLSDKVKNSIVIDNDDLQLSGDSASPGNSKLYGTNVTGIKGWYAQPTMTANFWNNVNSSSVFSGTCPQTYTDLNLSSIVGVNYAVVFLKIGSAEATGNVNFRTKGDTDTFAASGAGYCSVSTSSAYIWVKTDVNGMVEWKAANAAAATSIWVEGYIK